MRQKNRIIFFAAAAIIAAFAIIYKLPQNMEDILPHPYSFENYLSHNCFAGIPEKQKMYFPPDEGPADYGEIHSLLSEAKFIPDFRNIVPTKYNFPKWVVSGSKMFINHSGAHISLEFYSGKAGSARCTVNFHDDGTVYISTEKYRDVIWSYRLEDIEYFNRLWSFIEENGSVYIKEPNDEHWVKAN